MRKNKSWGCNGAVNKHAAWQSAWGYQAAILKEAFSVAVHFTLEVNRPKINASLKEVLLQSLYMFKLCYKHLKQEGEHTQPAHDATLGAQSHRQQVLLQAVGGTTKKWAFPYTT